MAIDLRGDLITAVAEVAYILITDRGIHEDTAVQIAMDEVYTIPLWGPDDRWQIRVVGLCPTAMFADLGERWKFEYEVWECVKGEWDRDKVSPGA